MSEVREMTPSGLSKHAARWYADCRKQFDFRTVGELETLAQAAHALTRIEECQRALKRDGHFINGSKGLVSHPAARLEHTHRAQFLLAAGQLGICNPRHPAEPEDD